MPRINVKEKLFSTIAFVFVFLVIFSLLGEKKVLAFNREDMVHFALRTPPFGFGNFVFALSRWDRKKTTTSTTTTTTPPSTTTPPVSTNTNNLFAGITSLTLNEANTSSNSTNPIFLLGSGGLFFVANEVAYTIQKELPSTNVWYKDYAVSNPIDTDGGKHPQNIFRLMTKSFFTNNEQSLYFNISAMNLSSSPNRNASNGVLFMSRYQDAQNLYYAGIRVDGTVVIKKKKAGTYYTMAQTKILPGIYNRDTSPNLLPLNTWMGIKLVTTNVKSQVLLTFYVDDGKGAGFVKVLEALDDGTTYGGSAFSQAGVLGLRTDFMDVFFKNYIAQSK